MSTTLLTGKSRLSLLLCLAGVLSFVAPKAYADDGDQADPPSRVGRISYTDGSVSLQPGGSGDWAEAAKNRPVTVGDKIWADKDSRAELQAGQASIHLGSMTALSFLNLDQAVVQMRLPEGSINFRVRELREGDLYEVDTPNAAFTVKEAGAFRIDVSENGDGTRVTVIRGEGEVTSAGKTYPVHAGERAEFNGTDNNIQYSINQAPGPDSLDNWAGQRDTKEENSVSAKYVSRDTVGYSDLDDNGTWSEEPNYGAVWYPNSVEVGWAPYSYGSWNWVGPWGWTWVDYSPWGFAPYHYGRWNYFGGRWGWCPGPIGVYPIYGPAFVGFLGGGFGFGFGGGWGWGGGVGWFPLGWGEPFHPWFHCSNRFVTNINIHNTTFRNVSVINNNHNFNYAYAHNVNAVTAVSRNTFVNGQAVNRGAAHLTQASLRNAQVNNRGAGFSPTKQSFTGAASANAHVAAPPSSIQNRSVMARTAPASAASHMPVHTMNTSNLSAGRVGNSPVSGGFNRANNGSFNGSAANNSTMTARQQQLSQNRPPSAMSNGRSLGNSPNNNAPQQHTANNGGRTWEAQGNTTDRGRAPSGFGSERSANQPNQTASAGRTDRPPWAGSGRASVNSGASNSGISNNRPAYSNGGGNRSYEPPQRSTPSNSNRGGYASQPHSYTPPSHSYSAPSRTYSAPSRSYPAPSHSYSAPSHSYSAPARSYSAPSHSSGGGGGGSYHGGGGGGSFHGGGGGGGSHGGSVSHGHR